MNGDDKTHLIVQNPPNPLDEAHAKEAKVRDDALLQVYPILRWFSYNHLPPTSHGTSQKFYELAWEMARRAWISKDEGGTMYGEFATFEPELAEGLRKLLEAKDCLVRANIALKK